ncbi:MAG: sigma-70 family RNA polymerase sigma factor [Flavobacteriales bacterium]|nr:sigma-70 family RNA polymerase sigma factor [Flavobacteriales bacterium]
MTPQEEIGVIERAKTDPTAFGPLYETHFNVVFGFIFKRVRNSDLTGELASNVFLKALHALPRYEVSGAPFSAWLIRIALNEVRLYFRRTKRDVMVPLNESDVSQLREELPDMEGQEQSLALLANCLGKLDDDDQTIIELRFFELYSFADIGGILEVSADNAKTRTYRALGRLRKLMTDRP